MADKYKAPLPELTDRPSLKEIRKAIAEASPKRRVEETFERSDNVERPLPTRFQRENRSPSEMETRRAGEKIAEMRGFVEETYYKPDWDTFEMALVAGIVHCYFVDTPIWFFIVGPPSTLKTTIIDGLAGMQKTFVQGTLTVNTLLSGFTASKKGKADLGYSLLGQIGPEGILTFPEFGAFLANEKTASEISNDLRMVHDGHFIKRAGSLKEPLEWKGKLTIIAGMTEKMEFLWSKDAGMGDRFVTIRIPHMQDPWAMGQAAAKNKGKKANNTETLQKHFAELIEAQYGMPVCELVERPKGIEEKIVGLAVLVAELRRAVQENRKEEAVYRAYSREGTGRLATMFCQLADGRASLYRRRQVDEGDLHLVQRVALDSIPWERHAVAVEMPPEGGISGKDLWRKLSARRGMTNKGQMRMALREMEAFGLVDIEDEEGEESMMSARVGWSGYGRELMEKAGMRGERIREVKKEVEE